MAEEQGRTPSELRQLADETESRECTGVTAQWCPVHGTCSCDRDAYDLSDPSCPLHARLSSHAAGASRG